MENHELWHLIDFQKKIIVSFYFPLSFQSAIRLSEKSKQSLKINFKTFQDFGLTKKGCGFFTVAGPSPRGFSGWLWTAQVWLRMQPLPL